MGGGMGKYVMGINENPCDEQRVMYTSIELLYPTPETNITLCFNYTGIVKNVPPLCGRIWFGCLSLEHVNAQLNVTQESSNLQTNHIYSGSVPLWFLMALGVA